MIFHPPGSVAMRRLFVGLLVTSAILSIVAIASVFVAGYALIFAPPPETMTVLPLRLASNPADPEHYDFNNPRPEFHAGDELVGDFHTCFTDAFGGPSVSVQSRRWIKSFDGTTRAPLPFNSMLFSVGCRATRSVIGPIPNPFPQGTYRVEGETLAYTDHYSRTLQWNSIWFDVVSEDS